MKGIWTSAGVCGQFGVGKNSKRTKLTKMPCDMNLCLFFPYGVTKNRILDNFLNMTNMSRSSGIKPLHIDGPEYYPLSKIPRRRF